MGFLQNLKSNEKLNTFPVTADKFMFFLFGIFSVCLFGAYNDITVFICILFLLTLICFYNGHINTLAILGFGLCSFTLITYCFIGGEFVNTFSNYSKYVLFPLCIITITKENKPYLEKGLLAGITFCSVIGLLAYIGILPQVVNEKLNLVGVIDGEYQLSSLFGYSNTGCIFFGVGVFLSIYLKTKLHKFSFYFIITVNIMALILTRSRLGYVCFIFSLLLYFAIKKKKVILYISITAFIAIITLTICLYYEFIPSTIASRIIYLQDALKVILKNPFGIGVGTWADLKYSVQSATYYTNYLHNGFLQVLLEGGIVSFVIYIGIFVLTLWKLNNNNPIHTAMLVLLITHSFVDIDSSYGLFFIIFGYIASFCDYKFTPNKLFKPLIIIFLVLTIAMMGLYFYEKNKTQSEEYFETKIENNTLTPLEAEYFYKGAEKIGDSESMYFFSIKWLELSPRSQEAFNAVYKSIQMQYKATLDENYINISMPALYNKQKTVNNSMNYLCRYLDKNAYISLP